MKVNTSYCRTGNLQNDQDQKARGEGGTNKLFLHIIAFNASIAHLEHLGSLFELSLANKPPRSLREQRENDAYKTNHGPLDICISILGQSMN